MRIHENLSQTYLYPLFYEQVLLTKDTRGGLNGRRPMIKDRTLLRLRRNILGIEQSPCLRVAS
jgi:hypothetical protein